MQIDVTRHEEIFQEFLKYHPYWEPEIEGYSPKNRYAIRVRLRDGRYVDYNSMNNSCRVGRDIVVNSPNDITDDDCRIAFSNNLVEYMSSKGFNQVTLAERTGLSTVAISKYMRGTMTPSITALQKIAYALNCTPDELLD